MSRSININNDLKIALVPKENDLRKKQQKYKTIRKWRDFIVSQQQQTIHFQIETDQVQNQFKIGMQKFQN